MNDIMVMIKLKDLVDLETRANCYEVVNEEYKKVQAELTELKKHLGEEN